MTKVKTEKEFADAVNRGDSTIEIEGNLANKTMRLRATGPVAWAVATGAIGIAVASTFVVGKTASSGGLSDGVVSRAAFYAAAGAAPVAATALGFSVTTTAIAIAVAAGSVGVLNKIRSYDEVSRADGVLVLRKKSGFFRKSN